MRLVLLLGLWLVSHSLQAATLLLILDDIGNNRALGERAVALPAPINLAFLPHTPQAAVLAEEAHQRQHGIMLHAPMENTHGMKLGPGGLYPSMNKEELQKSLKDSLNSIPHVQGFNNHMGSLLTQQAEPMRWVMEVAHEHGLYFIDSLTSPKSVALAEAKRAHIPTLKRDVFLDNDTSPEALAKQFNQAIQLAKKRGYAVIIGHPYPQTLSFLEKKLPQLLVQDVQLRRVDDFLQEQLWQPFTLPNAPLSKFQLQ